MQPFIAIVLPNLTGGGAERMHVQLAREWIDNGFHVEFVVCKLHGVLIEQLPDEASVVDLDAARTRNALKPLMCYLRTRKPDAVLAAMWPLTAIVPLAARLAHFRGLVTISEHSPLSLAYARKGRLHRFGLRASTAFGYRLADVRIGVSSGVADDMAQLSSMSRDRFTVIYNPAASGQVHAAQVRPDALRAVRGPLILTVGTLKRVKRHDLLLGAFARIADATDATLCVLGEGAERETLEAQVRALGLQDRALLPGYVADPAPWYAYADLFVLSSDYEGFGNVIVEAMEHGLLVVSTDCPTGPREILQDGKYGRLVPVGDVDALADAMLASLKTMHDPVVLKARAKDFAVDKVADQYLDLLLPGWRTDTTT